MDHQVSTECYKNHVQRKGWNLPVDMAEEFGVTKLEQGWRSYYQNDHFQDMDERRFGCVKGCDRPDPWRQQSLQGLKRDWRSSGSGMQAVFLSGSHPSSHSTKGSVGTGVFLPPGTRNAMEPTKKSGCSAVLLPAGVIQALKLHFDRMDRQSQRAYSIAKNRNEYDNVRQRLQFQMVDALWIQGDDSNECLPEWTY